MTTSAATEPTTITPAIRICLFFLSKCFLLGDRDAMSLTIKREPCRFSVSCGELLQTPSSVEGQPQRVGDPEQAGDPARCEQTAGPALNDRPIADGKRAAGGPPFFIAWEGGSVPVRAPRRGARPDASHAISVRGRAYSDAPAGRDCTRCRSASATA